MFVSLEPFAYFFQWRPDTEYCGNAVVSQRLCVFRGNGSTNDHLYVLAALFLQESDNRIGELHVRAREHRETDDVHIFLDGRTDDVHWSLPQPSVDDFMAIITKQSRNDASAPIMPIESWLRDQNA
ncbi:MAG: hypothetical protein APF78_01815 [Sphingomonadales bacterium BRH_c3]|nr:MAG: hypothetical protein APF78_01815 [Sphingomonadales bacterium BRH_c3]